MSNETTSTNRPPKLKRSRKFSIVTYIPKDSLYSWLLGCPWVQHFAFINHNRDLEDDGIEKKQHIHLLLICYEAKTVTAVEKRLNYLAEFVNSDNPQNSFVQILNDQTSTFRYLMHLDNKEKTRYNFDEITTDNNDYWVKSLKTFGLIDHTKNSGLSMFEDLKKGISTQTMIERYGMNYIKNQHHLKACLIDVCKEELEAYDDECYLAPYFKHITNAIGEMFDEKTLKAFWRVFEAIEVELLTNDGCVLLKKTERIIKK